MNRSSPFIFRFGLAALAWACGGSTPPPAVVVPAPVTPPPVQTAAAAPVDARVAVGKPLLPFLMPPTGHKQITMRSQDVAKPELATKWSVRVGKTSFRTTMAFVDGSIVVGTHGATLDKLNEPSDAVYVIDAKKGTVIRTIASPGKGDRDVSGVAVVDGYVYFATDNGYLVKAKLADGSVAWSSKIGTGVRARPAPTLGVLDPAVGLSVIIGDEQGVLHVYAADTGSEVRTLTTGENEYGGRGFVAAVALADVDGDGKVDIIAGARDGNLVAYRGIDGTQLWSVSGGSGIHASPSIVDVDGDGRLEVLASWSYSKLAIIDLKTGTERYTQQLEQDEGGIDGLFGSPMVLPRSEGRPGFIVQGTSWWGGKRGAAKPSRGSSSSPSQMPTIDGIVVAGQQYRAYRSDEGRVTATPVVMDLDDNQTWEAIVGTEAGALLAIDEDGGRRVLKKLGGGIEASALIADVDGDGTYEILVASNDGMLTCLSTGSRARPLVSRFRGEMLDNRGFLGSTLLRWEADMSGGATPQQKKPRLRRPSH